MKRLEIERRIVKHFTTILQRHGFKPEAGYDPDEEKWEPLAGSVWAFVNQYDDAWIAYRHKDGGVRRVLFILGNGVDVLSDYTYTPGAEDDGFEAATDELADWIDKTFSVAA